MKSILLGLLLFLQPTNTFVNTNGGVQRLLTKTNVSFGQLVCNDVTCDSTIVIVPAKSKVVSVIADLTTTFACTAVCTTATLSFTAGKTAGGNQYLTTFDADNAVLQRGLADGDLGASINRANAIQGGDTPSWSAATTISARFTSGTGNIGNGTVTNLSQGNIVFYVVYEVLP